MTTAPLEAVLRLQDLDTSLDQHRHRRATLPERHALVAVDQARQALIRSAAEVSARRDEVAARQDALEGELNGTRARITGINRRLYGGMVSATRELQAMAAEVEHLESRASDLEDRVIEVMEQREPLDDEVAEVDRQGEQVLEERAEIVVATRRVPKPRSTPRSTAWSIGGPMRRGRCRPNCCRSMRA